MSRRGQSGTGLRSGGWSLLLAVLRPTATLALLSALLVGASPARAATVTCPDAPLLSEEINRAGTVFVGEVRGPSTVDAEATVSGPVVDVLVEEIWRGPLLASTVRVSNPLYAGAPRIDLTEGGRYLFLADPTAGPDAREPVVDLLLRECSLTRPLTADLAGLRPPDAVVMPGSEPVPAQRDSAPIWPWAVVGVLVVMTAAAFLLRGRMGTPGRWLPWASGVATLVAVVIGVGLAGPEDASSRIPAGVLSPASATSAATPSPPSSVPATPVASQVAMVEDPALVVRISDSGTMPGSFPRYVSIHADGRVIAATVGDRIIQQRLTADGVERIREAVDASGMFGPDAPATATYTAVLRSGAESPQRGAFGESIVVGRGEGTVSVGWTPIFKNEADLWEPSAEIARLDELAALLWALDEWLPSDVWLADSAGPYQAARFRLTDEEVVSGSAPSLALADLDWPLATPLAEIPASRTPAGLLSRCVALTRGEAAEVVGRLAHLLDDATLGLGSRLAVDLAGDVDGRVHRLSIEPLMPDEAGCGPATMPSAEAPSLGPGAIALVRVDGLRIREAPGPNARALDAFRAGERVAVVAESTSEDGTRWWLVRQGPGDRQGWVNAGPPDGDPWLVAIGNGAIAFMTEPNRVGIMSADGSAVSMVTDGSPAAWSPDGRWLLVTAIGAGDTVANAAVAVVGADGSGLRTLATDAGDPVWSPDGTRVAFVRWGGSVPMVFIVTADGASVEAVAPGWWPSWSPDGSRLAMWRPDASQRPPGDAVVPIPEALWIVDVASGDERQITPSEVQGTTTRPTWSPDGRLIAAGDRLLGTDGSEVLRLEAGTVWADQPWSPDGEDLATLPSRPGGGGAGIALLSVDTGDVRTIVPAEGAARLHVGWSPDGLHLTFAAVDWTIHGDFESLRVLVVPASGGAAVEIGPDRSQFPVWQPLVSHPLD